MSKILIVSNRLPLQITIKNNSVDVKPSVGGLATGMKSFHQKADSKWIGWSGMVDEEITPDSSKKINSSLQKAKCIPVHLSNEELEKFYYGFSNKTIWPLFHYFTEYTEFDSESWEVYKKVNEKYAEAILENIEPNDKIWIHDYQLLLLPKMIKEKSPESLIGFFLHIPFPSFEVFRILPWRKEILEGMLGADLIGFHTYNYQRHFFSSVRRLLGFDIAFNEIHLPERTLIADSFPMGIDYKKFHDAAKAQSLKLGKDKSEILQSIDKHLILNPGMKFILSIDRLDYTKGIASRLRAFEYFLNKYPEFIGKVTLVMLSVPSRENVEQYRKMKSEVDELVGKINGQYSTINWTPVWYFYRSVPFENLIDLYISSDVALLTPIRDGMNLVAKEYIASRIDKKGVLILSEMAGAAQEMSESIVINPNSFDDIADSIKEALLMSDEEQIERNTTLQQRLKRYNIQKWAEDFMDSLIGVEKLREKYQSKKIVPAIENKILSKYRESKKRIIFLDYDGTLVGFKRRPEDASPDEELFYFLDKLADDKRNTLVLISGRDKASFDKWFKDRNYVLVTEHGVWKKLPGKEWELFEKHNVDWKDSIFPVIEFYVDRTPGSFIEEKNYSIAWHYRKVDPELGVMRANELKDQLNSFIANHNLEILEGNKVIEVKNSGINKGRAAMNIIGGTEYDFILGIGDDWTDEYLFKELPEKAITIKVGIQFTSARYNIESVLGVRKLLAKITS